MDRLLLFIVILGCIIIIALTALFVWTLLDNSHTQMQIDFIGNSIAAGMWALLILGLYAIIRNQK